MRFSEKGKNIARISAGGTMEHGTEHLRFQQATAVGGRIQPKITASNLTHLGGFMDKFLFSAAAVMFVCMLGFAGPAWSQTGQADFLARWLDPDPPCDGQPTVCSGLNTNTLFFGQPVPGGLPSRVMFQGARFSIPFPFSDRPFAYARFEFCNGAVFVETVPDSVQFINEFSGVLNGIPFDR